MSQEMIQRIIATLKHIMVPGGNKKRKFLAFESLKKAFENDTDIVQVAKAAVREIGLHCLGYAAPTLKSLNVEHDYLVKEFGEVGISKETLSGALANVA